jgi:dTDP-glucose 4,6-dehydratase
MKVLVTGGSGVLGRALISKLLEQGREVIVYDLKPPPQVHPKLVFIEGDVRDKQKVTKACKGCEIVFHLAAKMPQARLSEEGFYDINVRGTLNVADACVKNKVRRLVFASTTEIYGPQEISTPLDEEAPKLFTGPYSRNKWECEKRLLEYWKKYGLEVTFLRMPMVFGPGFYHEKAILAIFWMVRMGLPIPIPSSDYPLSFVSASDCADAFILAAERPEAVGEAFNIAAPDYPRLKPFLNDLAKAVESPSRVVSLPQNFFRSGIKLVKFLSKLSGGKVLYTPSELTDFALVGGAFSIEKARKLLGYSPKKTCLQAWVETYLWYFSQSFLNQMNILLVQRV